MTEGRAQEILQAAIDSDPACTITMDDVFAAIVSGQATVFETPNAVILTRIFDEPGERVLTTWLGGGNLKEIRRELRPRIERFARMNKCDAIEVRSRPGVERILKHYGFDEQSRESGQIRMRKHLGNAD